MATTTNGIYYPNDYESVADIPEDMKKMAESVDTKIAENKTEIDNIKTEQTTQNTNISNLQKDNTTNKQDITEIKAKDTEQDKYIAELEAENLRLREDLNGLPTRQASGESIDLNDSAEMRCDLKISGNSKQETSTQGKNYFTGNKIASGTNIGIEYSFDNSILKLNGTSTGYGDILKKVSTKVKLPAGTYKFKGSIGSGSFERNSKDLAIYLMSSSGYITGNFSTSGIVLSNLNQVWSFTIKETTEIFVNIFINGGGFVFNNLQLYIQIEKDNIGNFEQFTPDSPSQDYPSEVESCGDNINLYNAPYRENNKLIITATQDDYYKILSYYAYLEAGKKYRVSFESDGSYGMDSGTDTIQIFLMKDKSFDTIITIFSKNEIISPTVSGNYYIRADVNKNGKSHSFWNFKIKKGSTASPYSPYGQGCINEVICNKNLCNFGNLQNSHIGLTNNLNENVWKISGTATSNDYVLSIGRVNFGKFKAGKYCFSWKYSGNVSLISSGGVFISLATKINGTSTTIYNKSINTENKFTSFTLNEEAEISLGIWNTGNGNIYDIEIECQLELSETNTEIVEHKKQVYTIPTQQPMRSVGNTRDTFIKKDGKRYEHHPIVRIESYNGETITSEYMSNTGELSTGATVDYISDTPVDIECTEEQNAILDQIEKEVKTYKNITHMYSTDNVSSYKDVTYKKDIDTYIDNKISPVINAVIELGGNINV